MSCRCPSQTRRPQLKSWKGSTEVDGAIYPFGYGLSYTTLEYKTPEVAPKRQKAGGNITVTLDKMTISGHYEVMKKAKIAELKSRLSSYLANVKQGDTVLVCERQTPIARLVPFAEEDPDIRVLEAGRKIGKLGKIRPVRLRRKIDLDKLLLETREDA